MIVGLIETAEEKIVRLLVEEKAILKILKTLDGNPDSDITVDCPATGYGRSILKDDLIWLN
jgi:hypothetical protein